MDSDSTGDESTRIISSETTAETIAVPAQQPAPIEDPAASAPAETNEQAVTEVVAVAAAPVQPAYPAPAAELVPVAAAPVEQAYPSGAYAAAPLDPAYAYLEAAPPAAPAKRNPMALLGLILAIPVWPVGLVLSTLGLLAAFSRKTGKVLAVIGLVLSVLSGGAVIALMAQATSTVSASTALDEGCKSFEAKLPADLATLKADTATLTTNVDSAASSKSSIETVSGDLAAITTDLTDAAGKATHADVRADLNTMNTQLQAVSTTLGDIQNHSTSSEGAAAAALTTLAGTDTEIDSLCSTY